ILRVMERFLNFVWLKMLKASPRSCNVTFSPKCRFLSSETSNLLVSGPLIIPRPPLPTTFATGGAVGVFWKQAVLNQTSNWCAPPKFGSQRTFDRLPAVVVKFARFPRPAASKFVVTVYHKPDWNVTRPDTSQPPNTLPTRSCRLEKNGRS